MLRPNKVPRTDLLRPDYQSPRTTKAPRELSLGPVIKGRKIPRGPGQVSPGQATGCQRYQKPRGALLRGDLLKPVPEASTDTKELRGGLLRRCLPGPGPETLRSHQRAREYFARVRYLAT